MIAGTRRLPVEFPQQTTTKTSQKMENLARSQRFTACGNCCVLGFAAPSIPWNSHENSGRRPESLLQGGIYA